MEQSSSHSEGGKYLKEKKTRRRLRLSCVECTKRRQKCDRNHPCSLCITRGVSHLCRWETAPLARPAPARPPTSALRESVQPDQGAQIQELKLRIATLEKELEKTREQHASPSATFGSPPSSNVTDIGTNSTFPSDTSQTQSPDNIAIDYVVDHMEPGLGGTPILLDDASYETASLLALTSVAHHGEFIGRGSVLCALHSVTSKTVPRFLYAKSTDAMLGYREFGYSFADMPSQTTIEALVHNIPSMLVMETLTAAFFDEVNWRYGIPEKWFRGARLQMWESLQQSQATESQINANWLMLLFAILASAPQSAYSDIANHSLTQCSDDYFISAMMARRIAEDDYLSTPSTSSMMVSAADGTVLGCLATLLLCNYLAERGRVSEAWKLVGYAIRNAEAVGIHRDPDWKFWQMMSADEKLLRRRAWWGMYIWDKNYSYALGRPQATRRDIYDVELSPIFNDDGSKNLFNAGQAIFAGLADMMGDVLDRCFGVEYPDCAAFLEMDYKLEQWENHLPLEYQVDSDVTLFHDYTPTDLVILDRQRYTIHTWYLMSRLKLLLASSVGQSRLPQVPLHMRRSQERCILLSLQTIRFQTARYNTITRDLHVPIHSGVSWGFEGCFSLFEASVALLTTLTQYSWREKIAEAELLIQSALLTFNDWRSREPGKTGEIAARAIEVLITIQEQYWPETAFQPPEEKDGPEMPKVPMFILPPLMDLNKSTPPRTQYSMSNVRDDGTHHI